MMVSVPCTHRMSPMRTNWPKLSRELRKNAISSMVFFMASNFCRFYAAKVRIVFGFIKKMEQKSRNENEGITKKDFFLV